MSQFFLVIAQIAVCGVVVIGAIFIFEEPIDLKWWAAGLVAYGAVSLVGTVFNWKSRPAPKTPPIVPKPVALRGGFWHDAGHDDSK